MRLTEREIAAIKQAAAEAFGADAVVRLFGSRADDSRRGGDIDLYVETSPDKADADHEVRFRSLLWQELDEEQVDVVLATKSSDRWIDRAARLEGVIL